MGEAPRIAQQAESRPGVRSPRRPRPGPASFIIPPGPMSAPLGPGTRGAAPLPLSPHPRTPRPVLAGVGGVGGPGEDTWPGSCGDVGRAHDSGPAGHLVASLRLQAWGLRIPGAWGGGPAPPWERGRGPAFRRQRQTARQVRRRPTRSTQGGRRTARRRLGAAAPRGRVRPALLHPRPQRGGRRNTLTTTTNAAPRCVNTGGFFQVAFPPKINLF